MNGALLVAIHLVAPALLPRQLLPLYDRAIGRRARAELDRWRAAGEAWGADNEEEETCTA